MRAAFLGGVILIVVAIACLVVDGVTDSAAPSDVIVVFGSQVLDDGVPSPRLTARLDAALDAYNDGLAGSVIVSGGVGASGHDESVVMAEYLAARGVRPEALVLDGAGINSRATAENAASIMADEGWTSAIVVTQYFHVSRARLALRQAGVDQVTTFHADIAELRDVYSLLREVPAYARYLAG